MNSALVPPPQVTIKINFGLLNWLIDYLVLTLFLTEKGHTQPPNHVDTSLEEEILNQFTMDFYT